MKIVVGIGGQEMEGAVGEGNNSDLPAQKSSLRCGNGDEQAGHVRKPGRLEVDAVFGDGRLLHGAAGDIHEEETAEILGRGLDDGDHNGLAIGGPGKRQAIGEDILVLEKIAFEGAIAPGDLEVGRGGIAMLVQIGEALAVGRKGDGTVHVLNEQTRSSAKHGSVVKGGDGLLGVLAAHEVDVIAVGGKCETSITGGRGCDDLSVAPGGDVTEPEGLQDIIIQDVEQVYYVGR